MAKTSPSGRAPKLKHRSTRNPTRRSSRPPARLNKAPNVRRIRQKRTRTGPSSSTQAKVGFVFSNDPDPMLVERMWALEETGQFESHAIFWHRSSDLSFPFTPTPFSEDRFTQVNLPDPSAGICQRLWLTLLFAWRVMKWVRLHQFDVLHVVYPNMLMAAYLATWGRKVQIVYDIWDVNQAPRLTRLQRALYRRLLSKTPLVFTTSQAFIDDFVVPNQIVMPATIIRNISNAPYDAAPLGTTRRTTRRRPPQSNTLTIGCVGNLRVPTQLQMLVAAVEEVRKSGRDVRIRLSGAGSRKRMVTEAATSCTYIEYTGPYDYRQDAAKLYQELDIVFAVYPLENFNYRVHIARRLHDAVLSAVPVVASRGSHMGRTVVRQGLGWQIGHESTNELVALLTAVYDDREQLLRVSARARRHAKSHSFAAYRDRYVDAYAQLLETLPNRDRPTTGSASGQARRSAGEIAAERV